MEDGVQAIIVAAGRGRRMPVFGWLDGRGAESYEVEGMSKTKGAKTPRWDQCVERLIKKRRRSMVVWLVLLFNCFFEIGSVPKYLCRACIVSLYKGTRARR